MIDKILLRDDSGEKGIRREMCRLTNCHVRNQIAVFNPSNYLLICIQIDPHFDDLCSF